MIETTHFTVKQPVYESARHGPIGGPIQLRIVGVKSADVACKCGYVWTAQRGAGLVNALRGIVIECPKCGAHETIPGKALGII